MICGSVNLMIVVVIITSIKQYVSMLNNEMNNRLKQSKLHVDVIELDSKDNITYNLNIVHDRLTKLNKNISTTTDNEEITC